MRKNKNGFTLIEMVLVIALIGILAAGVMTGLASYRNKARASRAVGELGSIMQPMMMCVADGGTVDATPLSTGGQMCDIATSYGNWPDTTNLAPYTNYVTGGIGSDAWFYTLSEGANDAVATKICCTSASLSCFITTSACAAALIE